MINKQSGFTIIELIVVIALLGILSAVALPRFISVTDDAHDAAVDGAGAGFATGIALLKAQVVANGDLGTSTANVSGYGDEILDVNSDGYPVRSADADADVPGVLTSAVDCVEVWVDVFDANGPTASTGTTSTTGDDFQASIGGGAPTNGCEFIYKTQKAGVDRTISYDSTNGEVVTTIPPSS